MLAFGFAASAVACHGKSDAAGAAPASSTVHIYGLAPNEPVAAECKAYAQSVLRCVANPHFPREAKEAQTSALVQMMDRMKFADVPAAERAAAIAGASQECQDALSTLQLSSQVACPGVL